MTKRLAKVWRRSCQRRLLILALSTTSSNQRRQSRERGRGNHRRITLRSIESFEAQRRADEPNPRSTNSSPRALPVVEEELEIYYLGNEAYPNSIEAGYVCNASFFGRIWKGVTPSSILMYVAGQFGGGVFRIVRVLDGQVVYERTIQVPGPTKEQEVLITRALDS